MALWEHYASEQVTSTSVSLPRHRGPRNHIMWWGKNITEGLQCCTEVFWGALTGTQISLGECVSLDSCTEPVFCFRSSHAWPLWNTKARNSVTMSLADATKPLGAGSHTLQLPAQRLEFVTASKTCLTSSFFIFHQNNSFQDDVMLSTSPLCLQAKPRVPRVSLSSHNTLYLFPLFSPAPLCPLFPSPQTLMSDTRCVLVPLWVPL